MAPTAEEPLVVELKTGTRNIAQEVTQCISEIAPTRTDVFQPEKGQVVNKNK